jgi:DNA helicase HerA-like ATPase
MIAERPIGLTKGPGEFPHTFVFVSPDPEQALKIGEFVTYAAVVDGEQRAVLSRIDARRPLRLYPDAFLADPTIDPDRVAALVGFRQGSHELFELTATVIGYFDARLGDFVNPRLPPRTGRPVHLANHQELTRMLSKKRPGDIGAAEIGWLLSREEGQVPITLDLDSVTSTHMAIIASTGAGKSYLAAVLIEELMKANNRAAVLIVDPHGEYDTLTDMRNQPHFVSDDYRPEVKIFQPGQVKVRISALEMGDLYYLLPNLSDRMEYLLRRAFRDVRRQSQRDKEDAERWTAAELRIRLRQIGEGEAEDDNSPGDDRYAGTADALIWRLQSVFEHSIVFDDFEHLNLSELFRPGRCSVLQLSEVDQREQQVMVATLLRRLFRARTDTVNGRAGEGQELYLPYPAFVLVEEAHHFAPASADVISTRILKQILAEGRKFGVAVGLISQRPGKLDPDVLSQCNTQCLLRIVNPVDQARVAESVESVGRDLLRELPALTKGQAIVAGAAVNTPVLCRVRPRHTPHGAEDLSAPSEWVSYFDPQEQERRDRESAWPMQPKRRGESRMYK